MKLRELEIKDAELMLQWMHDDDVVGLLGTNFKEKTIDDCKKFIVASKDSSINMHRAIVDDNDVYMGTVSLKHIDKEKKTTEFAITVRKEAMGKGYSKYGMAAIIDIAINDIGLEKVYWCVSIENHRAIRFYEKNGYKQVLNIPNYLKENYEPEQLEHFIWFCVEK
jgi:RimJ/RimL family protein N-acetyltransferase